jgi:putative inorganic carbon (hco3(-)) transporter
MAFASLLLFLLAVYIRPGELITAWRGFPVAYVVLPVCALLTGLSVVLRGGVRIVRSDLYAAAFLAVAMASTVANGWMGGVVVVLTALGPSVIGYYIARTAISSPAGITRAARLVVLLSAFLAGNGLLQSYTGHGLGDVQALTVKTESSEVEGAEPSAETRIRGTGIFNDPNDLAYALVLGAPLNFWLWRDAHGLRRILALAALSALVLAIVLTRSRGGFLGLGVGLAAMLRRYYGAKVQITVLALAGLLFAVTASGRLGTFNASEASAQGRVEAWSAGLQMLKSHPVLGVGFGNFTEHHELVAHNSYIHVLAELGFVGGYTFVALVTLFLFGWRAIPKDASSDGYAAWLSAGTGALVCCIFISRQYSAPLFLLFGVGGSLSALRGGAQTRWPELIFVIGTVSVMVIAYLAVMVLQVVG